MFITICIKKQYTRPLNPISSKISSDKHFKFLITVLAKLQSDLMGYKSSCRSFRFELTFTKVSEELRQRLHSITLILNVYLEEL